MPRERNSRACRCPALYRKRGERGKGARGGVYVWLFASDQSAWLWSRPTGIEMESEIRGEFQCAPRDRAWKTIFWTEGEAGTGNATRAKGDEEGGRSCRF